MAVDPDPMTRAALAALIGSGDAELLADHVGRRLSFGTAGLRGELGPGPNRMNRLVVRQAAAGVARVLVATVADAGRRGVVVGHDARHGSLDFAADVTDVMASNGLDVHAFAGPVPTPLVAFALQHLGAAAAVVITASHNPASDNGMKVYWDDGAQIVAPLDTRIAAAIDDVAVAMERAGTQEAADAVLHQAGPRGTVRSAGPASQGPVADAYVADALRLTAGPPVHPVPVALTSLHGVGADLAGRVLREAGHGPVHMVTAQRHPDPDFPTVGFPNPEEPGTLDLLLALARETGARVALANDPDADRLAVAVPDRDGRWCPLTGDEVGALLAHHLLALHLVDRHRRDHHLRADGPQDRGATFLVATTVVSSRLVARMVEAAGGHFEETLTGFKWLCRPALAHPDWIQVLLYEEALGYAIGPTARDKDGITAALVVADLVADLDATGRTVWDVLDDLARIHGAHVTRNGSVGVAGPGWEAHLAGLIDGVMADPPSHLGGGAVVRSDRPAPDVLRLWTADDTRVTVRPSGTEPKLKYYCEAVEPVEPGPTGAATARARAGHRLDAVVDDVRGLFGELNR